MNGSRRASGFRQGVSFFYPSVDQALRQEYMCKCLDGQELRGKPLG